MKHLCSSLMFLGFAALSGCALDNDSNDVVLTGEFLGVDVSGIHYQSDSRTGTLANGQFEYISGEVISLSLFDQTLIEFEGKSLVQATDIAATFPDNTTDFYDAFFDGVGEESFIHLVNLTQLLAMLDNDEDPTNGFDVSTYSNVASVSTELDLSIAPNDFYEKTLIALANEVGSNRNVVPTVSVDYLYQVAEADMKYSPRSYVYLDEDNDGSVDSITEYTYTADNHLENETYFDGSNIVTSEYSYETNDFSRVTSIRYPSFDSSGNKTFERGYEYTYNNLGQVTNKVEYYDYDGDGENDSTIITDYTFDSLGLYATYTQLAGSNYTYRTYVQNDDGLVASYRETKDTNNDGTPEQILDYVYTYNSDGVEVEERIDTDSDANGTVDNYEINSSTYNENGHLTLFERNRYDSVDELTYNYKQQYTLNDEGQRTEYRQITDYDGDGTTDNLYVVDYTLDADGHVANSVAKTYNDGVTLSKTVRYVYDQPELDYLSDVTTYTDDDGDGTEDENFRWDVTLDEDGNYERRVYQKDNDNNGVVDEEDVYTYTNEEFTQGVGGYLFEYYAIWNRP